jgi:predicted metal-dependent peptidase
MPFFGHLLMNVPLEVSERIPTAAVTNEGRLGKLLVNPDFAKTLSRGELSAVMIHEVLHLAFNAFARMKSRDPKIWNKAHDYAINLMIDETRESNPKLGLAWSKEYPPLLDSKYAGMTAEEIYDALLQDSGGGGGNGSTSDGAQTDGEGGGPGGMEPMPGSGQGFSDATDCIMVEQPSPEDAARQERAFKNLLAEAVQVHAASRSAGKLPGSISEMVDGMLRVHVPWATQLAHKVDGRLRGGGTSFARLSKRSESMGISMPGRGRRKPMVGIAIDTSGSVTSAEVKTFLAVMREIMEAGETGARLIQIDSAVADDRVIEDFDEVLDDQGRFGVQGRGGTEFEPLIERFAGEEGPAVDLAVLFTDGYPFSWPDSQSWPCHLVVVTTGGMPPDGYDTVKFDHSTAK